MYSKKEAIQLKQEFWTAFGQYMQPILSAEGEKTNWINYKTGEKDIYFRMHVDKKNASISIELTHKDIALQSLFFEKFKQLQNILQNALSEDWKWQLHTPDENGKPVSKIYTSTENVSVFNKQDWPLLISFFKPRIIALDEFWSQAKYVFEEMR